MGRVECVCNMCGKTFFRYYSAVRRRLEAGQHMFCSHECLWSWNKLHHKAPHLSNYNRNENPMNRTTGWSNDKKMQARMRNLRHIAKDTYPKMLGKHEHRRVMEEALGRKLKPDEIVHHIDRNRHNNNLSNLMLVSPSEHARIHEQDMKMGRGDAK